MSKWLVENRTVYRLREVAGSIAPANDAWFTVNRPDGEPGAEELAVKIAARLNEFEETPAPATTPPRVTGVWIPPT